MSPPTRIANEPRSFAPHPVLTGNASKAVVSSTAVAKSLRPLQSGDLTRNLTAPSRVCDD